MMVYISLSLAASISGINNLLRSHDWDKIPQLDYHNAVYRVKVDLADFLTGRV
jgi:hypothetical protein